MQRKEIQRGDLFYYDFGKREGSVQSGERPVMVIQADNFIPRNFSKSKLIFPSACIRRCSYPTPCTWVGHLRQY